MPSACHPEQSAARHEVEGSKSLKRRLRTEPAFSLIYPYPQICIEQDFHFPYRTALTSVEISSSVIIGALGQESTNF